MSFFGDMINYQFLSYLCTGTIIFLGFTIKDKQKPKPINNLENILQGKNNINNTNNTILNKYISEESTKKLIPILGIDTEQLQTDIELLQMQEKTSVNQIIASSIFGLIGLIVFGGLGVLTLISGNPNTGIIFSVIGLLIFYVLKILPISNIKRDIKNRKSLIEKQIPDFLELLASITASGLTIQDALNKICTNSTGVIEMEFAKVNLEQKLNGGNWRVAMENMAFRNDVEILSDSIADILIADEKGTPIAEVLKNTSELARKLKINKLLEEAKKISVKIMIPMAIFNFLPIMALFMMPLLWEFSKVMGS